MAENDDGSAVLSFSYYVNEDGIDEIVDDLILTRTNMLSKDIIGNTALHYAAACTDNVKIIEKIINATSNEFVLELICTENDFKQTALSLAVEHKRIRIADYLLRVYNAYNITFNNLSLLYLSAQNNDFIMLDKLIENDCNVNEQNRRGQTALHFVAEKDNTLFAQELIDNMALTEINDNNGYTPLLIAAKFDNVKSAKLLLQNSAAITAKTNDKETILAVTIKYNSTKVFEFLINAYDQLCETVNRHALLPADYTPPQIVAIYCQQELLHICDCNLNTLLHIVARTGNVEIFGAMIDYYPDINVRNFDLQTPLHIAAENDHEEIFEKLLKISTFSLHLPDKNGETPLSIACRHDYNSIIEHVLKFVQLVTDISSRKHYLKIAVNTQNILLLKHIIGDDDYNFYDFYNHFDEQNQACFKHAIEECFVDGVLYFINSKNWLSILRRQEPSSYNPNLKSPMQLLIEFMPEMAKIVFDKCVVTKEQEDEDIVCFYYEFLDDIYYIPRQYLNAVLFPYSYLKQPNGTRRINFLKGLDILCPYSKEEGGRLKSNAEAYGKPSLDIIANHPLSLMINFKRYDLLTHDLVESYIDLKWNEIAKWKYYFLCFHTLIVLFMSTYVLIDIETKEKPEIIRIAYVFDGISIMNPSQLTISFFIGLIHFLLTLFKFYFDVKFTKIRGRRLNLIFFYFKYFLSIFFLIALVTPVYFFLSVDIQWAVVIGLNIWTWFSLLNFLKRHPRFGIYIVMVSHIIMSFLRFAPVFIILLLPFVLYFHVFIGSGSTVSSFFGTFVQTLVMMIGEFDYSETIAPKQSFIVSTIFSLFLFFATILLMNLLVGLAVSDISKIIAETSIRRKIMQIHTIQNIEYYMPESSAKLYWRGYSERSKEKLTRGKIKFTIFGDLFKWFGLPKSAIKDETFKDDTTSLLEQKLAKLENKMETHFEENKRNLARIDDSLKLITATLNNFKQQA